MVRFQLFLLSGRAIFSIGAFCLFPQPVLTIMLLTIDVKIRWLVPGPGVLGTCGNSHTHQEHVIRTAVVHDHSWSWVPAQDGVHDVCSSVLSNTPWSQEVVKDGVCEGGGCGLCDLLLELGLGQWLPFGCRQQWLWVSYAPRETGQRSAHSHWTLGGSCSSSRPQGCFQRCRGRGQCH